LRDREKSESIGKFFVDEVLQLFSTLNPPESAARAEIKAKSFFAQKAEENQELQALEHELKNKTFLEGDGFEQGKRDQEVSEKLKDTNVCSIKYPNVARWKKFVNHLALKK